MAIEYIVVVHYDGFLTPFRSNGGVYALLLNDSSPISKTIRLEPRKGDCHHHNSTMIDIDGDGLKAILLGQTCESSGQNKGNLVWLKQPKTNPTNPASWILTELVDGPDILIATQIINKTTIIVYAARFFTAALKYYYLRIDAVSHHNPTNTCSC